MDDPLTEHEIKCCGRSVPVTPTSRQRHHSRFPRHGVLSASRNGLDVIGARRSRSDVPNARGLSNPRATTASMLSTRMLALREVPFDGAKEVKEFGVKTINPRENVVKSPKRRNSWQGVSWRWRPSPHSLSRRQTGPHKLRPRTRSRPGAIPVCRGSPVRPPAPSSWTRMTRRPSARPPDRAVPDRQGCSDPGPAG